MPESAEIHFLVVDDDDASRATVVEYLKSLGYASILEARDGSEAMRVLDHNPKVNFVISDWDMPTMDGLSLLQRVKFNPSRANMPFLIMTSPVSEEAEKVVLAAENMVDAYIIKPFRVNVLREKIEKVLSMAVRGPQKQAIVVDDDPDARETVTEYLKTMGFREVKGLDGGRAALEYLGTHFDKVGLIVSDWEMPEVSGLELLQECKSHPKLKEIPFLMITSQSSIEKMKVMQAARARVDEYLLKPFTGDQMKKRIEGLLERSRSYDEIRGLTVEGMEHLERGRYQAAQQKFEAVLKLNPDSDIALRGMGDAVLKLKGIQSAIPFFKKAIDANPINAKSYIKLSQAYDAVGWLDKAIALLLTANSQISFNADLHFHLGQLYNRKGMAAEAKSEFEKTLEIQLDHQEARLMLEILSNKKGKE